MTQKVEVRKYYLFQSLRNVEFFGPVIVLFWLSNGLTMTQVMLLQSIYAIGVVLLEVPTGALADYFGKRLSLSIGALVTAIGLIFYGLSTLFWQFLIGELIVAVGMAFISGADSAYIHETLKKYKHESEYKKIEGRAQSLTLITRMFSNLVSGFVASISLGLTLITSGIANFLSFLVTLTFSRDKIGLEREENTNYIQIIKDSFRVITRHEEIIWLTLFFTFFNAILHTNFFFSQPYMQYIGVPIVFFGLASAGFNSINAATSFITDWIDKIGGNNTFAGLVVVAGFSLLMISSFPSFWVLPFFGVILACLTLSQTIVTHRVLNQIPNNRAATVLSFQNLTRRLVYAIFGPLIGLVSDSYGILWAFRFNLVVLIGVFAILLLLKQALAKKTE